MQRNATKKHLEIFIHKVFLEIDLICYLLFLICKNLIYSKVKHSMDWKRSVYPPSYCKTIRISRLGRCFRYALILLFLKILAAQLPIRTDGTTTIIYLYYFPSLILPILLNQLLLKTQKGVKRKKKNN